MNVHNRNCRLPNVKAARDIHVWCLAEEQVALSAAHIEIASNVPLSQTKPVLKQILLII
ncbi:Co/Zn/Cd efflux system component [Sporomusaceae bacterium BoRhaA]|nr:Co/Zn/Cd efflux system component [Pelorhabdus rhamnosifermentans]